jgi:PAS domain S-box-containing protein
MALLVAEPLHVLVVDDDSHLLRTLADILRLRGYEPHTARSGAEGLRLAEGAMPEPAIALVDLKLPDMDGLDVVGRLRALSNLTEVVVLTGNASVESAVSALRQQSCDYLIKPVAPDQLLATLGRAGDRWLRHQARESLRRAEERFRALIEGIGDVVFLVDSTRTIRYVSPSVARVLGRSPDTIEGREMKTVFTGGDASRNLDDWLEKPDPSRLVELTASHANGTTRFLNLSAC